MLRTVGTDPKATDSTKVYLDADREYAPQSDKVLWNQLFESNEESCQDTSHAVCCGAVPVKSDTQQKTLRDKYYCFACSIFLLSLFGDGSLQQILVATDSVLKETGGEECKHGAYTCDGKVLEELTRAPSSL